MRRIALTAALLSACDAGRNTLGDACDVDTDCPARMVCSSGVCVQPCTEDVACAFEQCCVAQRCVDPGPAGTCQTPSGLTSSLEVSSATAVAGVDEVLVTAKLRDVHGRPLAAVDTEILVVAGCDTFLPEDASCAAVAPASARTNAAGAMASALSSQVAGTARLSARATVGDSSLILPISAEVEFVAGAPQRIAFAQTVRDAPLGEPLADITVAFVDAFGNLVTDPRDGAGAPLQARVEIELAANAAGLTLSSGVGGVIAPAEKTFSLSAPVTLGGLLVPAPARGLVLVAVDQDGVFPGVPSPAFDVAAPALTSLTATSDEAPIGGSVWIDWTTQGGAIALAQRRSLLFNGALPLEITPFTDAAASIDRTRVVVLPAPPRPLDVDVDVASSRAFSSTGSVFLDGLGRSPSGELVLVGRYSGTVVIGERAGTPVSITPPGGAGVDGFVARYDEAGATLRWVVTLTDGGTTLAGSLAFLGEDVVVGTSSAGGGTTWRPESGATCAPTLQGDNARDATVARIDADGGLRWCRSVYGTANETASAVASSGDVTFFAVLVGTRARVQTGTSEIVLGGSGRTLFAAFDAAGRHLPARSWWSGINLDVNSVSATRDGSLVVAGGAAGTAAPLVSTDAASAISTNGRDATVFVVRDGKVRWEWHSNATGTDTVLAARELADASVVVTGSFASDFPTAEGAPLLSGGGDAFIAQVQPDGELRWTHHLRGDAIDTSALAVDGDRILIGARGTTRVALAGTPHAVSPGVTVPGALVLELDLEGRVRWSSQIVGSLQLAAPAPTGDGGAWIATSSTRPLVAGPLDPTALSRPNPTNTRSEGLLVRLRPHDFGQLDVERVGAAGTTTLPPPVNPGNVRPRAHVASPDGTVCVGGSVDGGAISASGAEVTVTDRDAFVHCFTETGASAGFRLLRDTGSSTQTDEVIDLDVLPSGDLVVAISTAETLSLPTDAGPKSLGRAGAKSLVVARLRPWGSTFAIAWALDLVLDAGGTLVDGAVAALVDGSILVVSSARVGSEYPAFLASTQFDAAHGVSIARFSADGATLQRFDAFQCAASCSIADVAAAPTGGATLAGGSGGSLTWRGATSPFVTLGGGQKAIVLRLDAAGATSWAVAGNGGVTQAAHSVDHFSDGRAVVGVVIQDAGGAPGVSTQPPVGSVGAHTAYALELLPSGEPRVLLEGTSGAAFSFLRVAALEQSGVALAASFTADAAFTGLRGASQLFTGRDSERDFLFVRTAGDGAISLARAGLSATEDRPYALSASAHRRVLLTLQRTDRLIVDERDPTYAGRLASGRTLTFGAADEANTQAVVLWLDTQRQAR